MKPQGEKSLGNEYESRLPFFEKVRDTAKFLLHQEINRWKIPVHSLDGRIKPLASFIAKAKQQNAPNPFDGIHDIVGLRVVCLFKSDLQKIAQAVREVFHVQREDDKAATNDPEKFGYEAIHFDVKFKNSFGRLDANIIFEIQIRTIAQDAWASVSHHLDYKKEDSIPVTIRKGLYALSGLFYVADTQFETLKYRYKEYQV